MADRLDNLRDLGGCDYEKRVHYREETERFIFPIIDGILSRRISEDLRACVGRGYGEMRYICESIK